MKNSGTRIIRRVLAHLREVTLLLAIEGAGLRPALASLGLSESTATRSNRIRMLRAATAAGILSFRGGRFRVSRNWRSVFSDQTSWNRLIDIVKHQRTYLNLVGKLNGSGARLQNSLATPSEQIVSDPDAYFAFLRGVASSHSIHARLFASLTALRPAKQLLDLGGGLGTFSEAWVTSQPGRSSVLVDLPGVSSMLRGPHLDAGRIRFLGADLNIDPLPIAKADVILLANVLHLIPSWPRLLRAISDQLDADATIVVFEADPSTTSGALFDFQVHLRAGGKLGLVPPEKLQIIFDTARLDVFQRKHIHNSSDPFDRHYNFWLCRRSNIALRHEAS